MLCLAAWRHMSVTQCGDSFGMDNPDPPLQTNPASRAKKLHDLLTAIRSSVMRDSSEMAASWQKDRHAASFHASLDNLAMYLALRRHDLRSVQVELTSLGLSSLGRCESSVLTSLDAVLAALASIAGIGGQKFPEEAEFMRGRRLIAERKAMIFGPDPDGPATRIMVTLPGEAAENAELFNSIISKGADCLRINCAHDGPDAWLKMIAHARSAAALSRRQIPIVMDLGGPKIRLVDVRMDTKHRLHIGDRFVLSQAIDPQETLPQASISHPQILAILKPGAEISINDGKIRASVTETTGGRVALQVTQARDKGEKLKPEKGLNVPNAELDIPALTEKDRADLDFVAEHADIVGYSFVQTPEDVSALIDELRNRLAGKPLPAIILKIETPLAVRNLPRLIVEASAATPVAVMIARGDLAVEIGLERLSEIQEEILWLCEAAHVPVVWATQVLEGLLKDGMASRAETTDAAMGQRAECVMLNKGPHLVKAVEFLDRILRRMDRHQTKKTAQLAPLKSW